jgi:ParB family transcriptional regulator, chromosome partitioning protein
VTVSAEGEEEARWGSGGGAAAMEAKRLDLDLHLLELRFANARLVDALAVEQLARSIERDGQIVPLIVAGDPASGGAVLVDGYRRVAALRRLGRDRAWVECWPCDVAEAVLGVLARSRSRSFAAIEEALLLRELTQGLGLSQLEVARRCGRDESWVNRRLKLLSALPEEALAAVRDGRLSSWAAVRVIAPLARARVEDSEQLLRALAEAPLSTRSLKRWFEHYCKATREVRERMVRHPKLFVDTLNEKDAQVSSERLRDGPEGGCEADLLRIIGLICRVHKQLPALTPLSAGLVKAFWRVHTSLEALGEDIKRYAHDPERHSQQRAHSQAARPQPARDHPVAQTVA